MNRRGTWLTIAAFVASAGMLSAGLPSSTRVPVAGPSVLVQERSDGPAWEGLEGIFGQVRSLPERSVTSRVPAGSLRNRNRPGNPSRPRSPSLDELDFESLFEETLGLQQQSLDGSPPASTEDDLEADFEDGAPVIGFEDLPFPGGE